MKAARAMGPAGPADRISMYWAIMAAAVALAFAFVTDQVWEDYYITYRTSRRWLEFDAVFLVFKRKPSSSDTLLKQ